MQTLRPFISFKRSLVNGSRPYSLRSQKMNLQFSHDRRRNAGSAADALEEFQQAVLRWKPEIEEFVTNLVSPSSVNSLMYGIWVNGQPLTAYFDAAKLKRLIDVLKTTVSIVSNAKPLLEDVTGMLCLVAAMLEDFSEWFQGRDAEKSWRKLLERAELFVERAQTSYQQNQETYDKIFELICRLLPPGFVICVKIAATLFALVWPHRHSIAAWISDNWKPIAIGVAIGTGLAIIAVGIIAVVKVAVSRRNRNSRN